VDDNGDAAEMLAVLLKFDGHEVETAFSGRDALDRIGAFKPDVALLDLGLPGLDGYEVARRIREDVRNGHVQLIAITGYGRDEDRERTEAAGFVAHLVKPVEFVALKRVLAELPVLP